MTSKPAPLSPLWWLYIPVALILIQIVLENVYTSAILAPMHSEGGPHETLQFFLSSSACIMAGYLFLTAGKDALQRLWFALACLGCLYITGEEVSWGQHIIGWTTPEFWSGVNDQNETNLHNTSAWLDQKPRLLLFIGIVFAGLVAPALRRWKPGLYEKIAPEKIRVFFPSHIVIPVTLGVLVPYLVESVAERLRPGGVFERVSEVQEVYMYYFLLLYMVDFKIRKKQR